MGIREGHLQTKVFKKTNTMTEQSTRIYLYIYIFRSLTSCLVEHSLGVVPSLFALCIAHWFTS